MQHVLHYVQAIIMVSKDPHMNKQTTAHKRKQETKTIIWKLQTIGRLKHGENKTKDYGFVHQRIINLCVLDRASS